MGKTMLKTQPVEQDSLGATYGKALPDDINSLIQKAVHQYFKWFPPDLPTFDDAVQECWLAFLEADYDPGKGKLSTFIFMVVQRKYQKLVRDANRDKRVANNKAVEFVEEIYNTLTPSLNMGGGYEKRYKAWKDGFYDE